jgi:hypothetical protein
MQHWLVRKARYYEFKGMKWWDTNEERFRRSLTGRYVALAAGHEVPEPLDLIRSSFFIGSHHLNPLKEAVDKGRLDTIYAIIGYLDDAARRQYGREPEQPEAARSE